MVEIRSTMSQGEVSAFFTEALKHYLAYLKQKTALEKGFGAWKNKNHPALATPQDSTAYVRATRQATIATNSGRKTKVDF